MVKVSNPHQLFQLIPDQEFKKLVNKWHMDRKVRSLTTWKQFKIMILSHILGLKSLREIELAFGVPKSTFADACQVRSSGFFEELSKVLLFKLHDRTKSRKHKKAIRDLVAIDSTYCNLPAFFARAFGWQCTDNKHKGGTKIHTVWNQSKKWIEGFLVTGGRTHDAKAARKLKLRSGCTYTFDRAYVDLKLWIRVETAGSHFVTRLKKQGKQVPVLNKVLRENEGMTGVLYDDDWYPSEAACDRIKWPLKTLVYRQVVYRDPETKRVFHFVTSDFESPAINIANFYKQRWSVELLFKWLKGHLNLRSFTIKNKNSLRSWIATSVCLHMLINLIKEAEKFKGTLWELLREVKIELLLGSAINTEFFTGKGSEPPPSGPFPDWSSAQLTGH